MMPCLNFKLQMIMLMKTTQEYEIIYTICLDQAKIQFEFSMRAEIMKLLFYKRI